MPRLSAHVTHKGNSNGVQPVTCGAAWQKLDGATGRDGGSPSSTSSEEFALSSCGASCSSTVTNTQKANGSVSSDCGLTTSDSEVVSNTEELDTTTTARAPRRPKRNKKAKDKTPEDKDALDPVRYKTKMCKNWAQQDKCPYGPRCLFAHGPKEMRSYTVNQSAITNAGVTASPERQFYAMGHFPPFMPIPFSVEPEEEPEETTTVVSPVKNQSPAKAGGIQWTHSPYAAIPFSYPTSPPRGTQEPVNPGNCEDQSPLYSCNNPHTHAQGLLPAPFPPQHVGHPHMPYQPYMQQPYQHQMPPPNIPPPPMGYYPQHRMYPGQH